MGHFEHVGAAACLFAARPQHLVVTHTDPGRTPKLRLLHNQTHSVQNMARSQTLGVSLESSPGSLEGKEDVPCFMSRG